MVDFTFQPHAPVQSAQSIIPSIIETITYSHLRESDEEIDQRKTLELPKKKMRNKIIDLFTSGPGQVSAIRADNKNE